MCILKESSTSAFFFLPKRRTYVQCIKLLLMTKKKGVTASWFRKSRLKLWGRKIENTSRCSYVLSPTANSFFKRLCLQDIDKKASGKLRLRLHKSHYLIIFFFFSNYYFFSFLQPLSLEERLETFSYSLIPTFFFASNSMNKMNVKWERCVQWQSK